MKIAALSDIHGNIDALQAVLAEIDREGVDLIVNCGDSLSGPLASAQTAELLMARDIPMIAGNHERQLLTLPPQQLTPTDACTAAEITAQQRAWLATAPATRWLTPEVFVCHGTPDSDLDYWLETVVPDFGQHGSPGLRAATQAEVLQRLGRGAHSQNASLILCGHTHVPRAVQLRAPEGGHTITVVNPGSVGLPGYDDLHPHLHWVETGSAHARYAVLERHAHGWNVQLRATAYDVEAMATLAVQRQRPDWALPLRTGRMQA